MGRRFCTSGSAIVAIVLALSAPIGRADHIVLNSGRSIDGDVAAEDDRSVTVEISSPGMTASQTILKSQIKSWDRPVQDGPSYVVLPITGVIGVDITGDALKAGVIEACNAKPQFIVLLIDSDGGRLDELIKMHDALSLVPQGVPLVAYVKKAYSAAAVLAMCCPKIYLAPGAVIGAAVPFQVTPEGTPADIEAKLKSAIEAQWRDWVVHAGHDGLILRGMVETDVTIFLNQTGGHLALDENGPGQTIKTSGEILTLTPGEAAQCGLAQLAADMTDLGRQLAGGPWHEASKRPANALTSVAAEHKRLIERAAAISRVKPAYDLIESRVNSLQAQIDADKKSVNDLVAAATVELNQIAADYQHACQIAQTTSDPNAGLQAALAQRDSRVGTVRQNLQITAAPLQADADKADLEIQQLRDREKTLIATIPQD